MSGYFYMPRALTDQNRRATLIAKDDTDETKIVEVTADPLTGALNTSTVASIGTQYDSGDATPATPVGTIQVFDDNGTITHVSDTNPLPVDVVGSLPSGTNKIGNVRILGSDDDGTTDRIIKTNSDGETHIVGGDGAPIKMGVRTRDTEPTALGEDSRAEFISDLTGKAIVIPYTPPGNILSGTASATGTSNTAVISAQGSGVRIYVTSIIISNSSDTDTEVDIKSATTTLATFPAPATGGAVHSFPVPLRLTANQALNFASLDSVTTMKVSAVGYSSSV